MNTLLRYGYAVLAGALVQPLWAGVWFGAPLWMGEGRMPTVSDLLESGFVIAGWGGAIVLAIGVPVFQLLDVYRKANAAWLAAVGFALVAVPMLLLVGGGLIDEFSKSAEAGAALLGFLLIFSLHGMFGALAFLWAWRRCGGERADGISMPAPPRPHSPDPA